MLIPKLWCFLSITLVLQQPKILHCCYLQLWLTVQPLVYTTTLPVRCVCVVELLILVPLVLHNNNIKWANSMVVNAFIFSFWYYTTTGCFRLESNTCSQLLSYSVPGITQQQKRSTFNHDPLWCFNSVPLVLQQHIWDPSIQVVNCFHIQYLWYYTTTISHS